MEFCNSRYSQINLPNLLLLRNFSKQGISFQSNCMQIIETLQFSNFRSNKKAKGMFQQEN